MKGKTLSEKSYTGLIIIASIAIPSVVGVLFFFKKPTVDVGFNLKILPAINASLNFITAILLMVGYFFIRNKQRKLHKYTMITAFALSSVFLISYVTYHSLSNSTHYAGNFPYVYFPILISHILLAIAIVPLVLFTLSRGLQSRFDKHKKIARWTLPLWLYVAVTGVITYIMISPYYQ